LSFIVTDIQNNRKIESNCEICVNTQPYYTLK